MWREMLPGSPMVRQPLPGRTSVRGWTLRHRARHGRPVRYGTRVRPLSLSWLAPEIPLTPQWFATRPDFAPVPVDGGNSWQVSDWDQVRQWLGWADEPLRYDYRTDRLGMIFVYCNDAVRERGVDARRPATELAHRESTGEQLPAGISLGVFAAVSPRNEPVTTLLQLALGKSGSVFGYHYDLTENTARPLRGRSTSRRNAWPGTLRARCGKPA